MRIDTIQRLQDLEPLREEWNDLADGMRDPLLRHDWFLSCAAAFAADNELRVVTVRRDGQLVAVAPLTIRNAGGTMRLELLGAAALNEPSGFLAADTEALLALIDGVIALKLPILLLRLPSESPLLSELRSRLPWSSILVTRPSAGCLSVPVGTSWPDYYKTLSSRVTGNLRRVKNKSKTLGGASISILSPQATEVHDVLGQVMEIEGSGWKKRQGSALSSKPELRRFFETFSLSAAKEGILRVAFLRFGADLAAAELAIVVYQRWWQLKIGYAEKFSKHYPGLQLTEGTLRYAFDHALESFEFLGSPASWEANWRPETRRKSVAAVYPASIAGLLAFTHDLRARLGRAVDSRRTNAH